MRFFLRHKAQIKLFTLIHTIMKTLKLSEIFALISVSILLVLTIVAICNTSIYSI